ncbi:hypothetical protein ACQP2E_04805 [Actinoplanes sp. CA-015351]|uniref:hypothetical protein n=1 Tax=Actinoplanes sp. CA-015351 TaxID=3239897 RepID=UPI003D99A6C8
MASAAGELIRVANLDELLKHDALKGMVAGLAKDPGQLAAFLDLVTRPEAEDEPASVDEVVRNAVISAVEQLANEDVQTANPTTSGLDFTQLSIPVGLEGLSIDTVEPDESTLTWQTYETYQDTTLLILAEIDAEVTLIGFAYHYDIGLLEEQIHVLDWEWNDHMAHVSTTGHAHLRFQIRLEQGMDTVEECELEGVEPLGGDDHDAWGRNASRATCDATLLRAQRFVRRSQTGDRGAKMDAHRTEYRVLRQLPSSEDQQQLADRADARCGYIGTRGLMPAHGMCGKLGDGFRFSGRLASFTTKDMSSHQRAYEIRVVRPFCEHQSNTHV